MMRGLSMSVAIALFACLCQLKADEPATTSSADAKESPPMLGNMPIQDNTEVLRSARIVTDLAEFEISNLSAQKTAAWMVARIHPGEMSGTWHNQGSYIQAETGKVIDSGIRPQVVILVGGQWELIELLSGQAPREGRYQWKELPPNDFDRNVSLFDYFSVFTGPKNDGTVICQFFEDKEGAEQFSCVASIPDGWSKFVKPAQEYYAKNAAEFVGNDLNNLRNLALSDNPFIGLKAIDHLLRNSTTAEDIDMLVDVAHSLPKYRQGVFVLRLLNRNDDDSLNLVLKAISRANSTSELTGMALGIYSWSVSQGHLIAPEPTRELHDKLMERWRSFDPSTAEDVSWDKMLIGPGTQKGTSTRTNE